MGSSVVHGHPRFIVLLSVLARFIVLLSVLGILLGHKLVLVYLHVKGIQSNAEGMEVARALGDGSAIILQGHEAVTTGNGLATHDEIAPRRQARAARSLDQEFHSHQRAALDPCL